MLRSERYAESYPLISSTLGVLVIFGFALYVRHEVFSQWHYHYLGADERQYLKMAKRIWTNHYNWGSFWLPGWPFVISVFRMISIGPREVVMLLGAFNCALVGLIASRLWTWKIGALAGFMMSLFPEHVFYSHYVFSEIGLETLILIFTYFVAQFHRSGESWLLLSIGYLILGCGMLYKHFAVIPFAAVGLYLLFHHQIRSLVCFSLLFLLPLVSFSIYVGHKGNDPLLWINSPIKSTQEWAKHRPYKNFNKNNRFEVFKKYVSKQKERSFKYFYTHAKQNFFGLWTPNSFVITRFARHYYKPRINKKSVSWVVVPLYTLFILLGLAGMIFDEGNMFNFYTITSLVLLSSMGLFWFLVSRYRLPFMFFFVLYSAYSLGNYSRIKFNILSSPWARKWVFALVLFVLVNIYSEKLPRLGGWY